MWGKAESFLCSKRICLFSIRRTGKPSEWGSWHGDIRHSSTWSQGLLYIYGGDILLLT
jgi:hypothetical protein